MKILLILLLLCTNAYAGIAVCYDEQNNIIHQDVKASIEEVSGNPNCIYYEVHKNGIDQAKFDELVSTLQNTPIRYLKWDFQQFKPVEKTTQEKTVVDELIKQEQKNKLKNDSLIGSLIKAINKRIPSDPITIDELLVDE